MDTTFPTPISKPLESESCGRFCSGLGYKYYEVEYGDQCFCGSRLPLSIDVATCDTPCAKHPSEKCGGTWALQMYSITPPKDPPMRTICAMSCDWCSFDPYVVIGRAVGAGLCAFGAIIPPLALVCEAINGATCGVAIGSSTITKKYTPEGPVHNGLCLGEAHSVPVTEVRAPQRCLKCRVAIDTNGMLAVTVTVPLSRVMSNIGFPVAGPTNTASYQSFQDNHVLVAGSASINDNESEYSYPGGDSTDDSNQDAQIDNDEVAYHFMRSILRTAQRDTARDATATIEEQLPIVQ
ncbi:hypothetical protein BJV78DRAFT_1155584 [Lactifluus subvellereus]|nr:hypothetical protein BJV78DRAFT_1155584 [Lactifluus subvellereus]